MAFAHLHRHSEYSVMDGLGTAEQYANRAVELGQTAMALTDHGSLSGALHHIRACEAVGLFPIVGVEAYFKPHRQPHDEGNKSYYHMVLLAKNLTGFETLMRLTSQSYGEQAFYYKPVIDYEMLEEDHEGLIFGSACASSYISQSILKGDSEGLRYHLSKMQSFFGEDMYIEVMPGSYPDYKVLNPELVNLANTLGVPYVATVDAHCPYQEWMRTHKILVEHIYEHDDDSLYLMSAEETKETFKKNHPDLPETVVDEAIANTASIVSRCDPFYLSRSPKYPRSGQEKNTLDAWCEEGIVRIGRQDDPVYRERLEYELRVIKDLDVVDYFLIVGDLVRALREKGFLLGAGRGSAAGSFVSYLVGITGMDPIAHGLLFERFLNPDRRGTPPDIDIDMPSNAREWAKSYLRSKYGEHNVADIITYSTYGAKSAIKRAGNSLKVPYGEMESIAKKFGDGSEDLEAYLQDADILEFSKKYPEVWEHATRLESQVSGTSTHASGVMITDRPVSDYMPTMRSKSGSTVTAWSDSSEYPIIGTFGFLKIDVLGLNALDRRQMAIDLIKERTGTEIVLDSLPVTVDPDAGDAAVLARFSEGALSGIFQFESGGMKNLLKNMKVDHFRDLSAAAALFRPGPMANIPSFVARKTGEELVTYDDERLREILSETHGLYVYQEQAMQIAKTMAGFTGGQAEELRKAIGKKLADLMATIRQRFIDGCIANGVTRELADNLWAQNESSARYSFNKSHSASYAIGAYHDMWLKHYYPIEYYTSLLTSISESKDKAENKKAKMKSAIREIQAMGIEILPPDVNISLSGFTADGQSIRFGLRTIKGIGAVAAKEIIEKRPYFGLDHLRSAVKGAACNRSHVTSLVESGAFDLFGERNDWTTDLKAESELRLLGFQLSGDHIERNNIVRERVFTEQEVDDAPVGEWITAGGEVSSVRQITTKKGEQMAFTELVFETSTYPVTLFPAAYAKARHIFTEGSWLLVSGPKDKRGGINAMNFCTLEELITELEQEAA